MHIFIDNNVSHYEKYATNISKQFFDHIFQKQRIRSTPEGKKLKKIIVSTKTLKEPVRLKCSNKTGTSIEIEQEQEQSSIKIACSSKEVHNSVSKERGNYFDFI